MVTKLNYGNLLKRIFTAPRANVDYNMATFLDDVGKKVDEVIESLPTEGGASGATSLSGVVMGTIDDDNMITTSFTPATYLGATSTSALTHNFTVQPNQIMLASNLRTVVTIQALNSGPVTFAAQDLGFTPTDQSVSPRLGVSYGQLKGTAKIDIDLGAYVLGAVSADFRGLFTQVSGTVYAITNLNVVTSETMEYVGTIRTEIDGSTYLQAEKFIPANTSLVAVWSATKTKA